LTELVIIINLFLLYFSYQRNQVRVLKINQWPLIFQRDVFSFKVLKQELTTNEIDEIKLQYKQVWNDWKTTNLQTALSLDLGKPKIESWTNGWKIRDHFWTCYRIGNTNPCIGILVNRQQLQVYLMYQNYKSDTRSITEAEYQAALQSGLSKWSASVNKQDYFVWHNTDDEFQLHPKLADYLKHRDNETVMIGKIWQFPMANSFDYQTEISKAIKELLPLYQAVLAEYQL